MKTIEIIVQPDGKTRIETKGFSGAECKDASRFMEQALGTRQAEHLTSDFYLPATTQQVAKEVGSSIVAGEIRGGGHGGRGQSGPPRSHR